MPRDHIKTALLVDDEPHIRHFIGKIIGQLGVETIWQAGNGKDALELHAEHHPDLILLDINMPEMTGQDALKILRERDPGVSIVMLTAMISREAVEACAELGADDFISKAAHPKEIREQLRQFLSSPAEESAHR